MRSCTKWGFSTDVTLNGCDSQRMGFSTDVILNGSETTVEDGTR